jgi:signal transduction histidine kinase
VADTGPNTADVHSVLLELAYGLSGTLDLQEVLVRCVSAARRLISFRGGSVALLEDDTLRIAAADPEVSPEVLELRLPVGKGLSGHAAVTGHPVYSPDLDADERVDPEIRKAGSNSGIVSYFAVPVVASGEVVGVLQVDSEKRDAFGEMERALLVSLAPFAGSAIQNAKAYQEEVAIQRRFEELAAMRSDFIAIATHELRTPLTLLIGFAELLSTHDDRIARDVPDLIRRIEGALDRLDRAVDELDRLAEADATRLVPALVPTSLGELIDMSVTKTRKLRPVVVEVDGPDTIVSCDPDRVRHALGAVLDNAVKFSPDQTEVKVSARTLTDRVEIEVHDRGSGFLAADAERIFDRFAQASPPMIREFGGLGIGLSVARSFLSAMGGTIEARPGPHGVFVISLPRDRVVAR